MRMHFDELFSKKNGMLEPKVHIHINGITMGPGVSFGDGVSFGGVNFLEFIGRYFEVEVQNGVYTINGIYN